ncbi:glycosyl hydrolase [Bosea sp. PAMC 26642]|uniref:glycosyl hydrolase n=1 Tax=Bosea sp. (strain PAMC 26642) TaxID=1792307 RepID=UPI00077037A4|nr:glycosyl hydrolase [Bosea sp. PAMC 26642]AMJ62547.1 hypothetical protein AXW83_21555 [Bosea sp. PAMC 26642]
MTLTRKTFLRSLLAGVVTPASTLIELSSATAVAANVPRPAIGVYTGYGLSPATAETSVKNFEKIIGRTVDFISDYGSDRDWVDARTSPAHSIRTWREVTVGSPRKLLWNQPLTVAGTPLAAVASGKYDAIFRENATALRINGFYDAVVRLGWDMNASWVSWAAKADTAKDYIAAFRRVATIFREVSPSFRICWSPARDEQVITPEKVYPGDDAVDFIGLSVVIKAIPSDVAAEEFFQKTVIGHGVEPKEGMQAYSLAWLAEFSKSHSKGMIIPDYGIGIDTTSGPLTPKQIDAQQTFVRLMSEWIVANQVALHCWRDTPETDWNPVNTRISLASPIAGQTPSNPADEKPNLAIAFRNAWRVK